MMKKLYLLSSIIHYIRGISSFDTVYPDTYNISLSKGEITDSVPDIQLHLGLINNFILLFVGWFVVCKSCDKRNDTYSCVPELVYFTKRMYEIKQLLYHFHFIVSHMLSCGAYISMVQLWYRMPTWDNYTNLQKDYVFMVLVLFQELLNVGESPSSWRCYDIGNAFSHWPFMKRGVSIGYTSI